MPKSKSSQVIISKGSAITDDSNVGLQLLKKMGWIKDLGLGKNGSGILEPVKASSNFGRKGLGKGPTQANIDTVQQVHFESILQSLQSAAGNVSSSSDEEEVVTSKIRKPRLCYGRYLQDKDISRCDEHSLKVILGKSVVESKESSPIKSCPSSPSGETVGKKKDDDHDFGVKTYSSSTDLKSYFAEKMRAMRSRQTSAATEPSPKRFRADDSSSKSPEFHRPSFSLGDGQSDSDSTKKTKSRKHEKKEMMDTLKHSDPSDTGSSKKSKSTDFEISDKKSEESAEPSSSKSKKIVTNNYNSSTPSDELSEPPRPDSPDIFVNSNILSLKGYPYY
ncbi:unnamed protein product [Hymenolepis diminuta]|uniref:G-patch domain-containing protein n=1 Tax=Hymenolepis diminuta TaxID=6216 RepID=A0A0R3SUK5_HYMDI|nr:unnamed protein product [Hymenolepis diminuta]